MAIYFFDCFHVNPCLSLHADDYKMSESPVSQLILQFEHKDQGLSYLGKKDLVMEENSFSLESLKS